MNVNELTLIVKDAPVSAFLLRVIPLDGGRSVYRVSVSCKLNKGECCLLRDSTGRELECFVVDCEAQGTGFCVDLKCLDDPQFEKAEEAVLENLSDPPHSN